jgi:hypothetical protein
MAKPPEFTSNRYSHKKAVYVLVSNGGDHYLDMLHLSAACLHRYSPGLYACVVTDEDTAQLLDAHAGCKAELDEVVVVKDDGLQGLGKADRSRYIKTSLRRHVEGEYLYIDIDAFPVGNLEPLFKTSASVSMTHDQNVPPDQFVFEDYESHIFKHMNWPLPAEYFNSGVMLVKSDDTARALYEDWHALWQETRLSGNHKDQPPLHEIIRRKQYKIGHLPKESNLLISLKPRCFWGRPLVYHISTIFFEERYDTVFHNMVRSMKLGTPPDFAFLDTIVASRYPWTDPDLLRNAYYTGQFQRLPMIALRKLAAKIKGTP